MFCVRQNTACRRNCSSNTKKTEPIFSTHTIFLIKNQITTQRPHNKKFLTILKTMHCKMPQMLMVPLSSDNVHLVLTGVKYFGTFSGANTLRKMVQSATTKSITNEQTKTENRPLKLHSEGGFCLLRIRLFSLSQHPTGKLWRAARKPQAKSGAVLLGRGAAASLALNPLYLTGGWNYNKKLQKPKTPCRKPRNQRFGSVRNFRVRVFDIERSLSYEQHYQ